MNKVVLSLLIIIQLLTLTKTEAIVGAEDTVINEEVKSGLPNDTEACLKTIFESK